MAICLCKIAPQQYQRLQQLSNFNLKKGYFHKGKGFELFLLFI
jgi:hypothetical protein